jgi:hypothetical protein
MAVTARRARLLLVTAWAASLALGLVFVFVKAPHPWGWEGFDNYRALGLSLARGETYATLEVPWGYPAFLAVFYRIFGDRQWIPLLVQVALNSLLPLLVYAALRDRIGEREALVGALLVGVVSFTTVYASTQTSDSLAAFLFVTATGSPRVVWRPASPVSCARISCCSRSGSRRSRSRSTSSAGGSVTARERQSPRSAPCRCSSAPRSR